MTTLFLYNRHLSKTYFVYTKYWLFTKHKVKQKLQYTSKTFVDI